VVNVAGQVSSSAQRRAIASYLPPRVDAVNTSWAPTRGGTTALVTGARFSVAPPLTLSASLVRTVAGVRQSRPCPSVTAAASDSATASDTEVVVTLPEGAGTGWSLLVTNQDPALGLAQESSTGGDPISYLPPNVSAVEQEGNAPAVGGFLLRINGSQLSTQPVVTVDDLPCEVRRACPVFVSSCPQWSCD
jgi:hypothetical protein